MQARGVGREHLRQISLFRFRFLGFDSSLSVGGSLLLVVVVVLLLLISTLFLVDDKISIGSGGVDDRLVLVVNLVSIV